MQWENILIRKEGGKVILSNPILSEVFQKKKKYLTNIKSPLEYHPF